MLLDIFSLITPYTAIIQLLAGSVYIIYLFDKKAEDPFRDLHNNIKNKYDAFEKKYQGSLEKKQYTHFDKTREKDENWWPCAIDSLSALSKISFTHCILILFYICGEAYFIDQGYLLGLFITAIITFIYITLIMIFYGCNNGFINTLRSKTFIFFFYSTCIILFFLIQKFNVFCCDRNWTIGSLSSNLVYIVVLIVCFQSLLVRLFANYFHKKGLLWRDNVLDNMRDNIDFISELLKNASTTDSVNSVNNRIDLLTESTKNELVGLFTRHEPLTLSQAVKLTNNEVSHIYKNNMEKITIRAQLKRLIFHSPYIYVIICVIAIVLLCI